MSNNRLKVMRWLGQEFVTNDIHPIVFATSKGLWHDNWPLRFEVMAAFGAKESEVFWVPPPVREGVDSTDKMWIFDESTESLQLKDFRIRQSHNENFDRNYGF